MSNLDAAPLTALPPVPPVAHKRQPSPPQEKEEEKTIHQDMKNPGESKPVSKSPDTLTVSTSRMGISPTPTTEPKVLTVDCLSADSSMASSPSEPSPRHISKASRISGTPPRRAFDTVLRSTKPREPFAVTPDLMSDETSLSESSHAVPRITRARLPSSPGSVSISGSEFGAPLPRIDCLDANQADDEGPGSRLSPSSSDGDSSPVMNRMRPSPVVSRLRDAERRAASAEDHVSRLQGEMEELKAKMRLLAPASPPHPSVSLVDSRMPCPSPVSNRRGRFAFTNAPLAPTPTSPASGQAVAQPVAPSNILVDLSVLQDNVRLLRQELKEHTMFCAVLKNNAFGHGIGPVAAALADLVDMIGIVDNWEAQAVRDEGLDVPMLRLRPALGAEVGSAPSGVHEVLASFSQAFILSRAALRAGKTVNVHIMVNLGENRMSFNLPDDLNDVVKSAKLPGLRVVGIMGHFAVADDVEATRAHLDLFNEQAESVEAVLAKQAGHSVSLIRHVANTAATVSLPEAHLDMVRVGGGLYGQEDNVLPLGLKPAFAWQTQVVLTRRVPARSFVGYGLAHQFADEAVVATLPVGYGHGLPKRLGTTSDAHTRDASVLVNGVSCPIVGRVSSAMCTVDVTTVREATGMEVRIGDPVTLMGRTEHDMLTGLALDRGPTAEDHAQVLDTSFDHITSSVFGASIEYVNVPPCAQASIDRAAGLLMPEASPPLPMRRLAPPPQEQHELGSLLRVATEPSSDEGEDIHPPTTGTAVAPLLHLGAPSAWPRGDGLFAPLPTVSPLARS